MKKVFLISILLMLFQGASFAKDSPSKLLIDFARKAALFSYNFAQEKAYLHFDNTGYYLGETIWFKAYVVNAMDNRPSSMSKTLYVEMLTQEGEVVGSQKIRLSNGVGSGAFSIPDSLSGGYYEVRAYTRSMLNFGKETIFSRVFPVFSEAPSEKNNRQHVMKERVFRIPDIREVSQENETVNVSFFPEGGSLVRGLPSCVAFKATDKSGSAIEVEGALFDSTDMQVTSFRTVHDGMGMFTFTPTSGHYHSKFRYKGKEFKLKLTEVAASGHQMGVQPLSSDSVVVSLQRSSDLPDDTLALSVICRGKLVDFRLLTIPIEGTNLSLSTIRLPMGVNQFTLYAQDGRVLCDRLYFVSPSAENKNKPATAKLATTTNKSVYKPYEKVQLTIQSLDTSATNTGTSVSIAVRDALTSNFSGPDNTTIVSNLLLSSDLKGYIAKPGWYFESNDQKHLTALNLLMLTQGWRRYKWTRMEGVEPFYPKNPIEEGLVVDGDVRSIILKKPVKDVDLKFWMLRGGSSLQGNTKTDSLGRFAITIPEIYDEWLLNIHTSVEDKKKDFRILLNRQFSPPPRALLGYDKSVLFSSMTEKEKTPSQNTAALLGEKDYTVDTSPVKELEGMKGYELEEVVTTAKRHVSYVQDINRRATINLSIDKELDKIQDLAQLEFTGILDFLRNQLPYFSISQKGCTYKSRYVQFKVYANDSEQSTGTTDIYINNGEENSLRNYPSDDLTIQDVRKILVIEEHDEIMKVDPDLAFGNTEDPVYIFLFLKKDFKRTPLGVRSTPFQGYTLSKEFFSPAYPSGQPVVESDHRRTLYWNPELLLDKTGNIKVEFYNNRTCEQMKVSAEGITINGVLLLNVGN